jgi:hypothetical protein
VVYSQNSFVGKALKIRILKHTGSRLLISAYLWLAKRITTFGTTANPELGNAFDTGILIAIRDIHPEKYARYINTINKKQIKLVGQD